MIFKETAVCYHTGNVPDKRSTIRPENMTPNYLYL